MATLVLSTAGAAIGGAIGGPFGAMAGRMAGALAGAAIDNALFADPAAGPRFVEGPRVKEMDGISSSEGAPVPRVYGRARIGGQVIWATRFEETVSTEVERGGRAGGQGRPLRRCLRPEDGQDDLRLLRQHRRRALRGADRLRALRVGGRQAARPHRGHDARPPGL